MKHLFNTFVKDRGVKMLFGEIKQLDNVRVDSTTEGENSFYTETLDMTLRFNEEWFNLRRKMMNLEHQALMTENTVLLNEGAKDFFVKIKDFFVKLWNGIKRLWTRFVVAIQKCFLSDKEFADKFRDKLRKIDLTDETYVGYTYTISSDIPSINPDTDFIINDKYLGNGFGEINNINIHDVKLHYNDTTHDEAHYDSIRGRVLGKQRVSADDFQDELLKTFRNEEDGMDTIAINSAVVESMLNVLTSTKDEIKKCEKMQRDIDKFYDSVIIYFNSMSSLSSSNGTHSVNIKHYDNSPSSYKFKSSGSHRTVTSATREKNDDLYAAVQEIARIKSEEARRISFIYNSAFSTKLDAIKERRKDFRKVLSSLLSKKKKDY